MIDRLFRSLATPRALATVSIVEGTLLGAGLEACFGEGRYRLIMLLGALGGLGIGVLARAGGEAARSGRRPGTARAWGLAAGPAFAVFAIWFLLRVLPLIREELKFRI